jgi:hypothetical protein
MRMADDGNARRLRGCGQFHQRFERTGRAGYPHRLSG